MNKYILFLLIIYSLTTFAQKNDPLKIGIVGLSHSHVHGLLGNEYDDVEIVGIVEPNKDLAKRYMDQYQMNMDLVYDTMDEMIEKRKPQAVTAFGSIYQHLAIVEKCAPLGIHVMVEKPLAVSLEHARKMKKLADENGIFLLTNYETTWYATNHKIYRKVQENAIGDLRKILVNDGHEGPIEIGVNKEFLDWLLDPVQNGGGALMDFGCYGANLITWLMQGKRPISVSAFTQQIKPDLYPEVDDDAIIILQYENMQAIIQASWNWPFSRKDIEVYGQNGYLIAVNGSEMRFRLARERSETIEKINKLEKPYDNPFSYFSAIVKGKLIMKKYEPTSLQNNMIAMEILDAAKESARTSKIVYLK
jgi:predicted dehydrogenase